MWNILNIENNSSHYQYLEQFLQSKIIVLFSGFFDAEKMLNKERKKQLYCLYCHFTSIQFISLVFHFNFWMVNHGFHKKKKNILIN